MSVPGRLRPVAEDELELMRSWRNAPTVRANMYTRHEISAQEHLAWWQRTRQRDDQQYYMYENAGSPLGVVAFTMIDLTNSNCSWAFYAAPAAPRGTGSNMEFLALEHAFGTVRLHKLFCEVLAFNSPVISLHRKFGFQVEGTFRAQHMTTDGYVDIVRLGMLASEWAGMREETLVRLTAAANGTTP